MIDREKVIKGLEHCGWPMECDECPYGENKGCFTDLKADALELLKEQKNGEATKPGLNSTNHNLIHKSVHWYTCMNCKAPVNIGDKYCHECGRGLMWDAD